jgi:hypothetical protein
MQDVQALAHCRSSTSHPMQDATFRWCFSRKRVSKQLRKGFDTFLVLMAWCIWRERNNHVFNLAMRYAA